MGTTNYDELSLYQKNQLKIKRIMDHEKCSKATAKLLSDYYDLGVSAGEEKGQADAQRFFRLVLGVEDPTSFERAYWNNPVPLKTAGKADGPK